MAHTLFENIYKHPMIGVQELDDFKYHPICN